MNVIVCDECREEFYWEPAYIQEKEVKANNHTLSLIFFACPECKKIYRISLRDARYTELQEDLEKAKRRIRRNNGRNDIEFQKLLESMVLKKSERLKNYAKSLDEKFNGTFTFDTSKNNKKERNIIYLP